MARVGIMGWRSFSFWASKPMSRYKLIDRISVIVGFVGGVALTAAIRELLYINEGPGASQNVYLIYTILFVLLASFIVVLRYMASAFLHGFTPIRKWLLSKEYVEGYWVDYVVMNDKSRLIGINSIVPKGESLIYRGDNYTLDGSAIDSFVAKLIDIDWPQMTFRYQNTNPDVSGFTAGILQITFDVGDGTYRPNRFSVVVHDNKSETPSVAESFRLEDEEILSKLRNNLTHLEGVKMVAQLLDGKTSIATKD